MSGWALDLGTTNTAVAAWDDAERRPRLVELPAICREPGAEDALRAPRVVPSAVDVGVRRSFANRFGAWGPIARRFFVGRQAYIGRPALERNEGRILPSFATGFKAFLGRDPLRTLCQQGRKAVPARRVARLFLRELLAEIKHVEGVRLRDLVITTPVEAFESYRAELVQIGRHLGIRKLRFVDEPVAAALGYGLALSDERVVLVVDFGGGTLDVALVSLTAREMELGSGRVLGKMGQAIGGSLVDRWLLERVCQTLDFPMQPMDDERSFWTRLMEAEARRVKEALFFEESETFLLTPPEEMRAFEAQLRGEAQPVEVTRDDLVSLLQERGAYAALQDCVDGVLRQARDQGVGPGDIADVLVVGGSTLLPGVYARLEERFGRDRVRAYKPFEAVAHGACAYAAGSFGQADFIVHDYAIRTHDRATREPCYSVIVPRGTRFPTKPDLWKRQLVPTCALGEPERLFKLVICEIGRGEAGEQRFGWDAQGNLRRLDGSGESGESRVIVPLNESSPTLGRLSPPHKPSDRRPRLEISFGVSAQRWLVATVLDLETRRQLMKEEPVVRLL